VDQKRGKTPGKHPLPVGSHHLPLMEREDQTKWRKNKGRMLEGKTTIF
jgi:hypothetical protein